MQTRTKTISLVRCALAAALMAVCAWITVPGPVPFTLQTFAVFCALGLLGGFRGTASVLCYILLGAVGLPVFSGFRGGVGALLGSTGGYILGFLTSALVYWAVVRSSRDLWRQALGMVLGLLTCYLFGTLWFVEVYTRASGAMTFGTALSLCVIPFLLPDALKIALALLLTRTLGPRLERLA